MNIIVHMPKDEPAVKILKETAAEFHAQSVIDRISRMPLSSAGKKRLLELVIDRIGTEKGDSDSVLGT